MTQSPLNFRRLATESGVAFGVTLVASASASVMLSVWLSADARGEVAASLLWAPLLMAVGSMGLRASALYFASQEEADIGALAWRLTRAAALQTIIIVPLGLLIIQMALSDFARPVRTAAKLHLVVLLPGLLTSYYEYILQGRLRVRQANALQAMVPVTVLLAVSGLWLVDGLSPTAIVVSHVVANGLGLVAALLMLRGLIRFEVGLTSGGRSYSARELLSYGWRAQVGDAFQTANAKLDQTIIAAVLGPVALGLYVTAVSIASLLKVVAGGMVRVAAPVLARASRTDSLVRFRRIVGLYWAAALPVSVGLLGAGWLGMPKVFGASYADARVPFAVLVGASAVLGFKELVGTLLRARGDPLAPSIAELLGVVITVLGLVLLLPRYGILGAAATSVLAYTAAVAWMWRHRYFREAQGR